MTVELMREIERLLSEIVVDEDVAALDEHMKKCGATEDEINQLEEDFHVRFSEEARKMYRYKNGSAYPLQVFYATYSNVEPIPFYFLSLEEMRENIAKQDRHMSDFPDLFTAADIEKLDRRIQPYLFNKMWIPFARMYENLPVYGSQCVRCDCRIFDAS